MGHPEFCSCLDLWFHGWVVEIWAGCAVGIKVVKLVFVPDLAGRSVSFPTSQKRETWGTRFSWWNKQRPTSGSSAAGAYGDLRSE